METRYALIKNNVVDNIIICEDPQIIDMLRPEYQHIELLDTPEEQKVAGTGWNWDEKTNTFHKIGEEEPDPIPPKNE